MNADLDATAIKDRADDPQRWKTEDRWDYDTLIQTGRGRNGHDGEVLIYDLSFEANEALWDRFMLSSIPYTRASRNPSPVWTPSEPLPVARYIVNPHSAKFDHSRIEQMLQDDPASPYFRAAEFLVNRGAFNINSTSIPAWRALLGTLRGLERQSLDGESATGENQLSRSVFPAGSGAARIRSLQEPAAWNGFRSLSDNELDQLAAEIVRQVRRRGPFLSLADFVNRRLDTDPEISGGGALDLAIRNARTINRTLERTTPTELRDVGNVATAANRPDSIAHGLPGFLTQGDLLAALAPALTARGDTFRIRAYGEARARDGRVARAWCEAVVQRGTDYLDPADDPLLPAIESRSGGEEVGRLRPANLAFGRRFTLSSFRWLTREEVQTQS
jgi:hypothetical protein